MSIDPNQTIYVRNLNEKIAKIELKKSLYALFSAYGRVVSIVAKKTRGDQGQAFVAFTDITAATLAMRGLQGFTFYGKAMEIQYAKTKSHAIAKLDGTYKPTPLNRNGGVASVSSQAIPSVKRGRDDSEDDSDSEMSE